MKDRFDKLIAEGDAFRADFLEGWRYRWYRYSPHNAAYARWKRACLALLKEAFGASSPHYSGLLAAEAELSQRAPVAAFSSFLEGMKRAAEDCRPAAPAPAYASDLVDDVLARAEALAARGHYASAVSLAGTMLEGLLRRLCAARGVLCPEKDAPERINDRLLEGRVYGRPRHREAALCLALLRSAEQCYTDRLNARNVAEMIARTRALAAEHFPAAAASRRSL